MMQNIKSLQKLILNGLLVIGLMSSLPSSILAEQIDGKDIDAVYKTKFHYDSFEQERKLAYEFFIKEIGKNMPWIEFRHIGVDLFDIDQDGEQEIFAYVNGDGMCPRVGCPFAILKKDLSKQGGYTALKWGRNIYIIFGYDTPSYILKSIHNGYHDLVFGEKDDVDLLIWEWDGEKYD
jgi:hypothetical protein